MSDHCAFCNSPELIAGADRYVCLQCGRETDMRGRPVPAPPVFTAPTWGAHTLNSGDDVDE